MHVGMASLFQNPGRARPDREVSYASTAEAERNMRLFAAEVMPALQTLEPACA